MEINWQAFLGVFLMAYAVFPFIVAALLGTNWEIGVLQILFAHPLVRIPACAIMGLGAGILACA